MAIKRAGTSSSAARRKPTKLLIWGPAKRLLARRRPRSSRETSLDRNFADAFRRPLPSGCPAGAASPGRSGTAPAARIRAHAVLVDEHQRRDQLPLRVQQVHLSAWRDHVRQQVTYARAKLIDQLDDVFAVAAHAFFSFGAGFCSRRANRTRSSPSRIVALPASRLASTRGSEDSPRAVRI